MKSHEVDFEIVGNDMQMVIVGLDPGPGRLPRGLACQPTDSR